MKNFDPSGSPPGNFFNIKRSYKRRFKQKQNNATKEGTLTKKDPLRKHKVSVGILFIVSLYIIKMSSIQKKNQ